MSYEMTDMEEVRGIGVDIWHSLSEESHLSRQTLFFLQAESNQEGGGKNHSCFGIDPESCVKTIAPNLKTVKFEP